jgi:hypothetical protein
VNPTRAQFDSHAVNPRHRFTRSAMLLVFSLRLTCLKASDQAGVRDYQRKRWKNLVAPRGIEPLYLP